MMNRLRSLGRRRLIVGGIALLAMIASAAVAIVYAASGAG